MRSIKMSVLISFFSFLVVFLPIDATSNEVFLAVLEQPQCKKDIIQYVRVLFFSRDGKWMSFADSNNFELYKSIPSIWYAYYDGKLMSKIITDSGQIEKTSVFFSRDFLLSIKNKSKVIAVKNKNSEFAGWCAPPKVRPIVLLSQLSGNKISDQWDSYNPSDELKNTLFKNFYNIVGKINRCIYEPDLRKVPYNYKPRDLRFNNCFRSKLGGEIISLSVDLEYINCDLVVPPEWKQNWFYINKDILFIGNEMEYIDSGDFNHDGKDELLFWHSGYNEDGYVLLNNDFESRINFYWKYH